MFDYPFNLPKDTVYQELGIGLESGAEEFRYARREYLRLLNVEHKQLMQQLETVYEAVDGLKEAVSEMERLDSGDSDVDELAAARMKLHALEERAAAADPEYPTLQERIRILAQKESDINGVSLDNSEQQQAYDQSHPPVELLKLQRDPRNPFANEQLDLPRRTALSVLRRELAEFLTEQGESVFHPSDLTRSDFSSDYTFNSLLDETDA